MGGTRGDQSDRLIKIMGIPAQWGAREFTGLVKCLSSSGKVAGDWSLERPFRQDGTGLDQGRLTLAHGMSVAALLSMKEIRAKLPAGGTVTIRFDSVSSHFEWPVPAGASWKEVTKGTAQARPDRRGREST